MPAPASREVERFRLGQQFLEARGLDAALAAFGEEFGLRVHVHVHALIALVTSALSVIHNLFPFR
jgi:hypothetical protein